jgi:hypothetical protein
MGSNPPLCASHAGLARVPTGRANGAWRHGFYEKGNTAASLEGMIEDLFEKQDRAAALLDYVMDVNELMRLLAIHFKNAATICKLLLSQKALEGGDDDLLSALGPALDLIKAKLEAEGP